MAEEKTSITGPVQIASTSAEIAAFELMKHIAQFETQTGDQKNRKYWLTLYRQCYKATTGNLLERIFEEK